MVSRRTRLASWIFRRDHPSRPKAMICCFFSSFKTFAMLREATYPPAVVNVLDVSSESMAAFQVFMYGRFWVFTEERQGPAGRIVNISSSGAKIPIPLIGAYSSSKCGLEGMSDALRIELMLFGIDVVMIEPGTVNTSMYDKGEKEDLSEFKQTEYWEAVQNFQKWIVNEARTNGLSPERLGEAVHLALTTAKPKARYAVIPQRFKNWTLPRLLPARMLDAELAKQMKLTRR